MNKWVLSCFLKSLRKSSQSGSRGWELPTLEATTLKAQPRLVWTKSGEQTRSRVRVTSASYWWYMSAVFLLMYSTYLLKHTRLKRPLITEVTLSKRTPPVTEPSHWDPCVSLYNPCAMPNHCEAVRKRNSMMADGIFLHVFFLPLAALGA